MSEVWVTYRPPRDCQCWRDVLCSHGLTWQEDEKDPCLHEDMFSDDVHESLADAVRALFHIHGFEAIGCLLRDRYRSGRPHATMALYVMPSHAVLFDNHDAYGLGLDEVVPIAVVVRKTLDPRSRPGDAFRQMEDGYRRQAS